MPKFASSVHVRSNPDGTAEITVDGEAFPWYTTGGIKAEWNIDGDGMTYVTVRLAVPGGNVKIEDTREWNPTA